MNRRRLIASGGILPLSLILTFPTLAGADDDRLGRDVVPTFEAIRLVVDADRAAYSGSVRIALDVRRPVLSIRFHADGPTLHQIVLRGGAGPVAVTTRTGTKGIVTLTAARPLSTGRHSLEIDFSNSFNTQATSLYRLETGGHGYTFTQFEAAEARKAFPCWDEPAFKIPYQLTLVVPRAHLAVSNTSLESETLSGDRKTVVFRRTPPLPSYLLAIATGPLETVAVPGMSFPTRVVTVAGQSGLAAEAARITPRIIRALETYFGSRYPYDKLDLLAVPEFWPGAMENAAAITFADDVLLLDPKSVTFAQRRHLTLVLAHELAHMWFGDMVTMEWWDDLWLNESFASWMEAKIGDLLEPRFRIGLAQAGSVQAAMATDAGLATRAMRQKVGALDNLDQLADELAYEKGQSVLGMFEHFVGPEAFRRGVLAYLDAHRWGNARGADLWGALSKASGRDIATPMSSFLDQPGLPLVRAEILPGGRVRLSQQRFLNSGLAAPGPALWQIPIVLKYPHGGSFRTRRVLLTRATRTFTLGISGSPAWIHPNAQEGGYYRWTVPIAALRALARDATRALEARERIGFIGNLSALLDAGEIRGNEFLEILEPFARDPEPQVVAALLGAVHKIQRTFVDDGATGGLADPFAAYVRRTLGPAASRFGLSRAEGEDEAVSLLRPRLIASLADAGKDDSVMEVAIGLARAYLADPASIDRSLAGTVTRLAALRGDRSLFKEYRRRFEKAVIPAERDLYLAALGSFRDPDLVQKVLDYALDGPLRPQEILSLPFGLRGSPEILDRRLAWVMENYPRIRERVPEGASTWLPHLTGGCSLARFHEARAFFSDPAHSPPGTGSEIAKVGDEVTSCASLREREGAAVSRYLREPAGGAWGPAEPAPRPPGAWRILDQ